MAGNQVLLVDMPELIDGILRETLADVDVNLLPRGTGFDALLWVTDHGAPPVVIVLADGPDADQVERNLLLRHPQTVILRVENGGRRLAARAVEVRRQVRPGIFTRETLIDAIESVPTWEQRFD